MKASVRQPGNGLYELGAYVNDVFVPFVTMPETHVDTIVQAAKGAETPPAPPTEEQAEPGA